MVGGSPPPGSMSAAPAATKLSFGGNSNPPQIISPRTSGLTGSPSLLTASRLDSMGYRRSAYAWRSMVISTRDFPIKMEAYKHKVDTFKQGSKLLGYDTAALIYKRKIIVSYLLDAGLRSTQELKIRFAREHPNEAEEFAKFIDHCIKTPNKQQSGRGSALNLSAVNTRLDDNSPMQGVDVTFNPADGSVELFRYEAAEILNTIDQDIAYNDITVNLINDGKDGCSVTKLDPNDPSKTIEIVSAKKIPAADGSKEYSIAISAKDDSPESIRHFTDLVSMLRQGSSNTITFSDLGAPIGALDILQTLIVNKNMHVVIPEAVKERFLTELAEVLQEPQYANKAAEFQQLAGILLSNARIFGTKSNKELFTRSPKAADEGSYVKTNTNKSPTVARAREWLRGQTVPLLSELGLIGDVADIVAASSAPTNSRGPAPALPPSSPNNPPVGAPTAAAPDEAVVIKGPRRGPGP